VATVKAVVGEDARPRFILLIESQDLPTAFELSLFPSWSIAEHLESIAEQWDSITQHWDSITEHQDSQSY
jgi:hypothetical protein